MSNGTEVMEKLVSLCKRRGFIFQSSEIYGGTGSVWDYGPLGVELKRNIKDFWWRSMVHERDDIEGLDAAMMAYEPDSPEFDDIQAYRYVSTGKRPNGWIPPIV